VLREFAMITEPGIEWGYSLIPVPELAAEALEFHLAEHFGRRSGSTEASLTELIPARRPARTRLHRQ
jgi:hypothetical protein